MVENTDCKQELVAQYGRDSLEAEVSILGQIVLLEPRTFVDDVVCLRMSRN